MLARLRTITMLAKECQLYVTMDVLFSEVEKLDCAEALLDQSIHAAVRSILTTNSGMSNCMARARRACDLMEVDWSVAIGRVCSGLIQEGGVHAAIQLAISWLKGIASFGMSA